MYLLSYDISIKAVTNKLKTILHGQSRKRDVKPQNRKQGCMFKCHQFDVLVKHKSITTDLSIMFVQYVHFGNNVNC